MDLVPFDQRDGFIMMNGEMIKWKDAKVHVLTHALHYGSSVFEGERSYGGTIFKGHEHSLRLIKSGELMEIDVPITAEELDDAKAAVCKANNIVDGYVRAFAWRGSEEMGVSAHTNKIHVAIAAWDWPSYFSPEMREKGIRLKTATWKRPSPESAPTQSKAAGLYMICTMSKHAAENEGYDDALMLDYRGYVAEATGANIFFIQGEEIHTPIADCFLNGITRQTVIQICKDLGYQVIERHMQPEEIKNYESAFLTGTAAEVTAIGEIDGNSYVVGPVLQKIRSGYEDLVRSAPRVIPAGATAS